MYRNNNRNTDKITDLLGQNVKLFHAIDLKLIWGIESNNTLYTTIKRYLRRKILYSVKRGFYASTEPLKIDSVELGIGYLRQYAYLSTESVLSEAGIIMQNLTQTTLISSVSQKFQLLDNFYRSRRMKDALLFNPLGIEKYGNYYKATPERAVADLLYFNKKAYFDNPQLIDWKKVKQIQKGVGFI